MKGGLWSASGERGGDMSRLTDVGPSAVRPGVPLPSGAPRPRRGPVLRHSGVVVLLAAVLLALGLLPARFVAWADMGDVGTQGLSHSGTGTPTGTKRAESVLWFNGGFWWGVLWDTVSQDFHIFKFANNTWTDTGVTVEKRANTHHDVLWDGSTLYVASHQFVNDGVDAVSGYPSTLYRFSYDSASQKYTLIDSSQINNYRTETLTIDKDSAGTLWATWAQGKKIWLAGSTDGKTWTRFAHPDTVSSSSPVNVSIDDNSAVIRFGDKMGLMWSRQVGDGSDGFYWSVHVSGQPLTSWSSPAGVVTGQNTGDDHMNLKWLDATTGGRVFAAVKTSFTSSAQPLIQLLALTPDGQGRGTWSAYTIAKVSECPNRVIVLIDQPNRLLRTYATYPKPTGTTNAGVCTSSGGAIYEKDSDLSTISFDSTKVARIVDADQYVHNVSSTKQNLTSTSGSLIIADVNATSRYWYSYQAPEATASPSPTQTPTASPSPTETPTASPSPSPTSTTQASVRSSATYASTVAESSSAVPLPSGWRPGDVVYVGYELTSSSGSLSVPAGWVEAVPHFRSASSTSSLSGVLRRVMQAADPDMLTISHTSGRFTAVSAAIQGADTTAPEDVTPTVDNNIGVAFPNVRIPSIKPIQQNTLLLTFAAVRNGTNGSVTTFTAPAGMTGVAQVSSSVSGASNAATQVSMVSLSSNSPTGIRNATVVTSGGTSINQMGSAIAVRSK
jgi:hypothetical protein